MAKEVTVPHGSYRTEPDGAIHLWNPRRPDGPGWKFKHEETKQGPFVVFLQWTWEREVPDLHT